MIGKTLGGRYIIKDRIDSGGMAYIYKALCKKTNSIVALKVLKDKFAGSTEYVDRFKREAQAAFALSNEHIVHVSDIGYDENVYYMVMEYIDGPTLKNLIENKGALPEEQAVEYSLQICSALSAAHKKGIIHRDIKPHNILMESDENLKVTDFGIAKSVASGISKSGQVIGSVYYVSPEQAKGEVLDQRSDIYSLGIVMYEMLTGRLPYTGEKSVSVALKHINERITPPKQINEGISDSINKIILKATSKDKHDRYESIDELKKDLTISLIDKSGEFVEITEHRAFNMISINLKKSKIWKITIIAVALLLLVAAGVFGGNALFAGSQAQPTQNVYYALPSLVGMDIESAKNILDDMGVGYSEVYDNDDTAEAGIIIEQSPDAGTNMQTQDAVVLTVSLGPEVIYMPNLIGMTETEAVSVIEDMGLIVAEKTYEIDETVIEGTVISQIPAAESDILTQAEVNLVISSEPEKETGTVPQVVDTTLEQAANIMSEAGFQNIYVYQEESEKEPGTIVSQSPEQGVAAQFDNDIDLHISMYDDLKYMAVLNEEITIEDIGSKVKIVYEEEIDDKIVNFKVHEIQADPGEIPLSLEMFALTGGVKKVKVFINKSLAYEFEIYFYDRSENIGG